MKRLFFAAGVMVLLAGCAGFPVKARVCYTTERGSEICAESDGKSVLLDARVGEGVRK